MSAITGRIQQSVISTFVDIIGHGEIFSRIVAEIERNNVKMPFATGAEKRKVVIADLRIIFNDLAVPVGKSIINLLLELAVSWLKAQKKPTDAQ